MMVDESEQGRGYGSEALDRVIGHIATKPFGESDSVADLGIADLALAIVGLEELLPAQPRQEGSHYGDTCHRADRPEEGG